MFIGSIQTNPYANPVGISALRTKSPLVSKQVSIPSYDRVELGNRSQNAASGFYAPVSCQLKTLETVPYTWAAPDCRLQNELLPPSEQTSYDENDALVNQFLKQSRIDGFFDGDSFVSASDKPVGLILKDYISDADLESFRNKLAEQGLGGEIDWRGVENDFAQIGVGFDNVERFEQKVDYLASRYAVLKDRIENQVSDDMRETELQKLEQIFAAAKEKIAGSFAESVGGFFESLGQTGAAENMKNSVLSVIDQKANDYMDFLAENDIYAGITDADRQWLKQDDAYMAARLRENFSDSSDLSAVSADEKDLAFAGVCAKSLYQELQNPTWNLNQTDEALGRYFAAQFDKLKNSVKTAGVSGKMADMITSSFQPFMEKMMDALDGVVDRNRGWIADSPFMGGALRTNYVDRECVYRAFHG